MRSGVMGSPTIFCLGSFVLQDKETCDGVRCRVAGLPAQAAPRSAQGMREAWREFSASVGLVD